MTQPRALGLDAVRHPLPAGMDRAAVLARLRGWPGVRDVVVAESTFAVWFDPDQGPPDLVAALAGPVVLPPPRTHVVAVRYDGPDLAEVGAALGLAPEEVARRHAAQPCRVLYLGFVPGFAYLGDVDPGLVLPRRATPRARVPAGAVGLAAGRTAIYPGGTPGGWHLIGHADPACLWEAPGVPRLHVGDHVSFVAA